MSWVDRLPVKFRVYAQLMRLDKPVGIYLLLLPGWWGIVAATPPGVWPDWQLLALFAAGAVIMRGVGCIINDLWDVKYDQQVARTATRPLAAGKIDRKQALLLAAMLSLIGLLILIQFNVSTILLGIAAVGLVVTYPLMKRITWWPQAFLGLTFNMGVPMGWAAAGGGLQTAPLLLYLGAIAWTIGYDTIYAQQDLEDDARIGVRSTARRFQSRLRVFVALWFSVALLLWWCAGLALAWHWYAYFGLVLIALHFLKQLVDWRAANPASSLRIFKRNVRTGVLLLGMLLLNSL